MKKSSELMGDHGIETMGKGVTPSDPPRNPPPDLWHFRLLIADFDP
ncbi:MAG: hypothetical protein MUC65_06250 [Pontiellaceae bacterium]|jgi:hypothetical protein|nr:hypothetical protein [Pontiellaceae bacterium]